MKQEGGAESQQQSGIKLVEAASLNGQLEDSYRDNKRKKQTCSRFTPVYPNYTF